MEISLIVYFVISLSIGSAVQETWGSRTDSALRFVRNTLLISLFWPIALILAAYDQIALSRTEDWVLS